MMFSFAVMDDVFKQVRAYRFTNGLPERLSLVENICRAIQVDLRRFILGSVRPPSDGDVCQETLKSIALGLKSFNGNTKEEFWGWCYRIARNKISDHFRKLAQDRTQPMPEQELYDMMDLSVQLRPPTAEMKHDLDHVMELITSSKPECYDFLWKHYVFGLGYDEIAAEKNVSYDAARMRVGRCLEEAKSLIS